MEGTSVVPPNRGRCNTTVDDEKPVFETSRRVYFFLPHRDNNSRTDDACGSNEAGSVSSYDQAMDALSSLITQKTRADLSNDGIRFELMFDYVKFNKQYLPEAVGLYTHVEILDLEESISKMKIIHVAGTKGKGSTCTFTETILRNCGFRTGIFTSPRLIDVKERFRLDGFLRNIFLM